MATVQKILTVTLNPALDKICRQGVETIYSGGKGVNVARALKAWGVFSEAFVVVGGKNGRTLKSGLKAEGVLSCSFSVKGETRVNTTLIDEKGGVKRILEAGPRWLKRDGKRFLKAFASTVRGKAAVVLSGSLPPGVPKNFYTSLVQAAHHNGAITVLDASGGAFKEGLKAKPFLIKPNCAEAQEACGFAIRSPKSVKKALQYFHGRGIKIVLISLGEDGLAGSDGRNMFWARGLVIKKGHTVGCGDASLAGFLAGVLKNKDLKDSLALAAAFGAANLFRDIPGGVKKSAIQKALLKIKVERL